MNVLSPHVDSSHPAQPRTARPYVVWSGLEFIIGRELPALQDTDHTMPQEDWQDPKGLPSSAFRLVTPLPLEGGTVGSGLAHTDWRTVKVM